MESKMWRILLPLLFSLANQASALEHTVVQKSPNQLQFECSKYLSPEDVACNHRCLGLVGRFWNDSTGMVSQTNARYFRPNYGQDYLGRTRQCLRENVKTLPRCASCLRADTGLKCYENNFGQLLVEVPQFVPVTEVEITQTFWVCAQMLQISFDRLGQISKEGYSKTSEGRCLMRCFLIRAGFYNDCLGPNIERFAVQADGYTADYERSLANCYARLKQEQLDSCSLATRVLDECIQNNKFSYNNVVGDLLARL